MAEFINGLKLSELFYQEAVQPIIQSEYPYLSYSAALIGLGSEVLGFDTEMSVDHHWGPRVLLFINKDNYQKYHQQIVQILRDNLPYNFKGYSTNFTPPIDEGVTQLLASIDHGPVNHRVEIFTLDSFFQEYLSFDLANEITPADWLIFPMQKLRTITAGAVFHDQIGLQSVRDRFAYYPDDIWFYLLAAGWNRIAQEEHLMGRAGIVNDEIGSALIGARLVRDLMNLCFLMEREYAPYPKWFGTAFNHLKCAKDLTPALRGAQTASSWQQREEHLIVAYQYIAAMHNRLNITDPLPTEVTKFFGRPFAVISVHGFCEAILAKIADPIVKQIASRRLIGSVDQFSDSTDILSDSLSCAKLRALYHCE